MKKIMITAFLLAFIMVFAGCNLIEINPEKDMQRTVAVVDGHKITKDAYAASYDSYWFTYQYYYGYSQSDLETSKMVEILKENAIEDAIIQKILQLKAEENGCYDFSQSELDEIQASYDDYIDSYWQSSKTKIEEDEANSGLSQEELDALIQEDFDTTLESIGFDKEIYIESLKNQKALQKLEDIITAVEDPTESEIQAAYDEKVETQKTAFLENPSEYESSIQNGDTIYYNLPDTRQARHILIGLPADIKTQISTLRQNGEDEDAELLLKSELAKIKEEADMVYGLAKDGEDFDGLIAEYGDDPGMEEDNYYIVVNGSTTLVSEFVSGLFSLQNVGDFTQPIASDLGYHIILFAAEVPSGSVPYDSVKDDIKAELISSEKQNQYITQLQEWREQAKVKIYESRLNLDY